MFIRLSNETRIVEIWLINAERDDQTLRSYLKPLYSAYRKLGFIPVVFMSSNREPER